MKGVPLPIPDIIKLPSYHYLDVFNTLLTHKINKLRPPETLRRLTHTYNSEFVFY